MTCIDFTNFLKLAEFTCNIKRVFQPNWVHHCILTNFLKIWNCLQSDLLAMRFRYLYMNFKKIVKSMQLICTRDSTKVLKASLCLPKTIQYYLWYWKTLSIFVFHFFCLLMPRIIYAPIIISLNWKVIIRPDFLLHYIGHSHIVKKYWIPSNRFQPFAFAYHG